MSFCDKAIAEEESFELTKELIQKFISENIRASGNVEDLAEMWEKSIKAFDETERLNMDKKQVLLNVISGICKVI